MNKRSAKLAIVSGGIVTALLLSGSSCNSNPQTEEAFTKRMAKAAENIVCGEKGESLECKNLAERERRMSLPNAIGYVYLYNFDGSIKGYYTIKGKVSSTQSQRGSTDTVVDVCQSTEYCPEIVEAAGDDGSSGPNEEGIFFFTTEGAMITYSGEYLYSDKPQTKLSTFQIN